MKKVFIPLLALLFHQHCSVDNGTAYEFSHKMESIYQSHFQKSKKLAETLKSATISMDFSEFSSAAADMENQIDEQILKVKTSKNAGGSENLQTAVIEYLEFEKEIVHSTLASFRIMNKTTTEAEKQAAIDNLRQMTIKETQYRIKLYKAQQEFAAKNGFKYEIEVK